MKFKRLFSIAALFLSLSVYAENANDLFAAAVMGRQARVEALLAQGLDVNGVTGSGRTSLMGASYNGNLRTVKTLLSYGADVNIADQSGTTALMDAIMYGNQQIVQVLIAAGADVNAQDNQKQAVLARAKKTQQESIIKMLEAAGAQEQAPASVPTEAGGPNEEKQGDATAEGTEAPVKPADSEAKTDSKPDEKKK